MTKEIPITILTINSKKYALRRMKIKYKSEEISAQNANAIFVENKYAPRISQSDISRIRERERIFFNLNILCMDHEMPKIIIGVCRMSTAYPRNAKIERVAAI
jgi:hypothetical protein